MMKHTRNLVAVACSGLLAAGLMAAEAAAQESSGEAQPMTEMSVGSGTVDEGVSAGPAKAKRQCKHHGDEGKHGGHGMGGHGGGEHAMGGRGEGGHGKGGHGGKNKHQEVVQRLDLMEARLAKIEAMLEILLRR